MYLLFKKGILDITCANKWLLTKTFNFEKEKIEHWKYIITVIRNLEINEIQELNNA